MLVERLTRTDQAILEHVACYRFLTSLQLLALGVTTDKGHLYGTLRSLVSRRPAFLGVLDFGVLVGHGRLPRLYFLTPQGASMLEDIRPDLGHIDTPSRVRLFHNDYFHRIATVNTHIAVRQWTDKIGARIDYLHSYFDHGVRKDGRAYARTRVMVDKTTALIPDIVFSLTAADKITRLFAVEIYNDHTATRPEKQLLAYFVALQSAAIEKAFAYDKAVRILCLFEEPRVIISLRERFKVHPFATTFNKQLFLKSFAERAAFATSWQRLADLKTRDALF